MSVYWVRRHLGATMIHIKSCLELEMNMDRAQYREREREAHKIRLHAHVGLMPWSQSSLPDLLRLQITKKRPDFILVSSTANQTVDSYPSMGGAYIISLWIVVYGVSHTTMHQQKPWRIGSTGATCRNMHNHPVPYVPPLPPYGRLPTTGTRVAPSTHTSGKLGCLGSSPSLVVVLPQTTDCAW